VTKKAEGLGVVIRKSDNSKYEGYFKDHKYHGKGRKIWFSGDTYTGKP
jgi:hypothetical protein